MKRDGEAAILELAELIRKSADELLPSCRVFAQKTQPLNPINTLPPIEHRAWLQYELDVFADVIVGNAKTLDEDVPCAGVDLFSAPGMRIIAPAEAAVGQLNIAQHLVQIIRREFERRPEQYTIVMNAFEEAMKNVIGKNVGFFSERVTDGIRSLRQQVQDKSTEQSDSTADIDSLSKVTKESLGSTGKLDLSDREVDVIRLVAAGRSNSEIASTLNITQNTVKNHIRHMLEKLGVSNRVHLSVYAIQHEIIALEEIQRNSSLHACKD